MYIEIDTKYQEGLWLWSLETAWNTFGVRYDPASNWCQPFVLIPLNFHSFTPNAPHRKLFGIKIHFRFKACVDCGVQCTSVSALSWFFRHRDVLAQNRADPLCHSDPPFNQKTLPIVTLLIDYRCLNHKYLSDNPGKTQHSGSRHKHHQTLNTHHQQNTLKTQHNMNNAHQQHTSHTHTFHTSHPKTPGICHFCRHHTKSEAAFDAPWALAGVPLWRDRVRWRFGASANPRFRRRSVNVITSPAKWAMWTSWAPPKKARKRCTQ